MVTKPQKTEVENGSAQGGSAGHKGVESPIASLFRQGNFRLLWSGEAVSLLGDQFYMIALPWLVLRLTGDALSVGAVLALESIPRALFMLVGGALTDRFTPRAVMLTSNLARMLLVAVLAGMVLAGQIELWMLYAFALLFGLGDAFFFPAQNAMIPHLARGDRLQSANALMQGTMQLSLFAGPVLAGSLIALFSGRATPAGSAGELSGIGLAFAIDALSFLVSALTLWRIRLESDGELGEAAGATENLLASIRKGLEVAWNDAPLRSFFLLIAGANLLVNGPVIVGIPILADLRFAQGAAAFGIIMSAYGGGSLLGTALAAMLPKPAARSMGIVLGAVWSGLGLGVALLGLMNTTLLAALVAGLMGAANGYVVILFVTWLQSRTPQAMLGRMMSLLMFASAGLMPVSNVITGALIRLDVTAVFVGGGSLMALLVFLSMLNPAVRAMEATPVVVPVSVGD
jgi:Major Facilitator Superfamily